jgi:HD-GYP domain-containing protein (c-di-GMP phosphodiesterase class II)
MLLLGRPARPVDALLFVALVYLSDALSVQLPGGAHVGVAFAGSTASMLLFGPGVPTLAALLSAFALEDIRSGKEAHWRAFNAAQLSLATAAMYLVFVAAGGRPLLLGAAQRVIRPQDVVALILGSGLFFLVNSWLTAISLAIPSRTRVSRVWLEAFGWMVLDYLALALVGALMAGTYAAAGTPGVVLFVAPLLIARQTFVVYMGRRHAYHQTVHALVAAIEAKDSYTRGHSERVADFAERIAETMNLRPSQIEEVRFAALLHDLGKIAIERAVLAKPDRLDDREWTLVQEHPDRAARILGHVGFLRNVVPGIRAHHERLDGTGYGQGIAGEGIPLYARILAVADCFDAMTSARPYRAALSTEEAVTELVQNAGTQFDPAVVQAFLQGMNLESVAPTTLPSSRGQLSLEQAPA